MVVREGNRDILGSEEYCGIERAFVLFWKAGEVRTTVMGNLFCSHYGEGVRSWQCPGQSTMVWACASQYRSTRLKGSRHLLRHPGSWVLG